MPLDKIPMKQKIPEVIPGNTVLQGGEDVNWFWVVDFKPAIAGFFVFWDGIAWLVNSMVECRFKEA